MPRLDLGEPFPCLGRGPSETLTGVPCARGPDAGDLSWQVLQPARPAMPDRLGDRLAVAVVSSISSPCTIWPQDCRVSRLGKRPATRLSRSPPAPTGNHRLPWQQRLPRLGCVSQTRHDRGSRTYAVIRLTGPNHPLSRTTAAVPDRRFRAQAAPVMRKALWPWPIAGATWCVTFLYGLRKWHGKPDRSRARLCSAEPHI